MCKTTTSKVFIPRADIAAFDKAPVWANTVLDTIVDVARKKNS